MGSLKNIIFAFFLLAPGLMLAQDFRLSQYQLDMARINPAFTGIRDYYTITGGYRMQWAGADDAPNSFFLSGYTQLKKARLGNYKSSALRTSRPEAFDESQLGTTQKIGHGIGIQLYSGTAGPLTNTTAGLSYAVHIPLNKDLDFTLGSTVNYFQQEIDPSKLTVRNPDNDDLYQSIIDGNGRNTYITADFGLLLYSRKFYVGFSGMPALSTSLATESFSTEVIARYQFMGGVRIPLNRDADLSLNTIVRYDELNDVTYDANVRAIYQNKIWGGINVTSNNSFGLSVGMFLKETLTLGYSYDITTSVISNGTHEIILGLALKRNANSYDYLW